MLEIRDLRAGVPMAQLDRGYGVPISEIPEGGDALSTAGEDAVRYIVPGR